MYLHLGQNEIVSDHRIIGIFDLDKCSYGKRCAITRQIFFECRQFARRFLH